MNVRKALKTRFVRQSLMVSYFVGAGLLLAAAPSLAQTTTSTDPTKILTTFKTSTDQMDDIGGAAAAMGMATTVFAGGALIVKRFIYS
jgi:fructose-specific phosphotransferase system IIC component